MRKSLLAALDEQRPSLLTGRAFSDRAGCGVLLEPAAAAEGVALAARTYGPGPKLDLARSAGRLDVIGADLVHHGVNEMLAIGAAPLLFLLHVEGTRLASGEPDALAEGVARACRGSGVILADADAAEIPALGGIGLVGTILGLTRPGMRLDGRQAREGDRIFGIAANGPQGEDHAVWRPLLERLGLGPDDPLPGCGGTVSRILLAHHKNYRGPLFEPVRRGWVTGLGHAARGGLAGALGRALPEGLGADIDLGAWQPPPLEDFLARASGLGRAGSLSVANGGLGMLALVAPAHAEEFSGWMALWHEECHPIGRVAPGAGVRFR